MITITEGTKGYTIFRDGQALTVTDTNGHPAHAQFTASELAELATAGTAVLKPVSTGAVTPAKARMRPPIMRYPVAK